MTATRRCCSIRTQAKRRRAAAAAEFALVAPLLCMLLIGMCELGRATMVKEILTDAARHGCRTGIVPGANNSAINSELNSVLTANHIDARDATVTIRVNDQAVNAGTATLNDKISVRVSIPYSEVSWMPGFWFMNAQSVESEAVVMLRQG